MRPLAFLRRTMVPSLRTPLMSTWLTWPAVRLRSHRAAPHWKPNTTQL